MSPLLYFLLVSTLLPGSKNQVCEPFLEVRVLEKGFVQDSVDGGG